MFETKCIIIIGDVHGIIQKNIDVKVLHQVDGSSKPLSIVMGIIVMRLKE